MRNVIIERRKKFTGSLAKFDVFVEDREQFDRTIGDVPVRSVGVLKNGDSISFQIGYEETRVFVMPQNMTINVEMMRIPMGESDVTLTGAATIVGSNGAFWFDNNDTDETQELRKSAKKGGKKTILWTILLTVALIAAGVIGKVAINGGCAGAKKTFTVQEMTIELTKAFKQDSDLESAAVFRSDNAYIDVDRVRKDTVRLYEDIKTLDDYAAAIIDSNVDDIDDMGGLKHENGIPYVEYTNRDRDSGNRVKGYVAFYESQEAYWYVEFMSLEKDYKKMRPSFVKWAKSVTFND